MSQDNYIVIDPGRSNLLYCMREGSTADNPNIYRFTKPLQDKIRKIRCYRQIIGNLKTPRVFELKRRLVGSSSLENVPYLNYLRRFREVHRELLDFYANTRGQGRAGLNQFPVHRKLRLSAIIKKNRCDAFLVRWLQEKFPDATFIMGNWSAPYARFHEPIRNKGFRRLLQKNGMPVLLIDEYLTGQFCHIATSNVIAHGLLRCSNRFRKDHSIPQEYRYFNRDTAACINMIRILAQSRINGVRPPELQRPRQDPQEAA